MDALATTSMSETLLAYLRADESSSVTVWNSGNWPLRLRTPFPQSKGGVNLPVERIISGKSYELTGTSVAVSFVVHFTTQAESKSFSPRTALGRKLMELRQRAIAKGLRLLSEAEIIDEVRRRRGEIV